MNKEILAGEHCPHCKRHCSLKAPHCGKGKALAEKKLKEEKALKAEKRLKEEQLPVEAGSQGIDSVKGPLINSDTEEWKKIRSEIRLVCLYQKVCKLLPDRKAGKQEGKAVRLSILAALGEKDGLTQKELKESLGLHSGELEEALQKLEKKGYVNRKPDEGSDVRVSLTGKGLESAKEYMRDWKKENDCIFSRLTEEEKGFLEHIMKKIMK